MNKKYELFEDYDLDMELTDDYPDPNSDELKDKVLTGSSEALCEIIVCDRYFGSYNKLAIACMEELGRRRANGEVFDFESYIDNSLKDFPKLDFKIPNITDALKQIISMRKKNES